MTFVYPLLLGGLLLAGLPVLLHFLIRKKPKSLLFPAFRFLVQKRRTNTRNLRLKHLLLLLLRVALVVLVCFALARPRLSYDSFRLLSREKPVAMVLIFDTSPSMEYKSNEMTRLDLAKQRSLELLDQLPDECRVLILETSAQDNFAREEWLNSLEKARQRIQGLTIRPNSVPVTKALDEALRGFDRLDEAAKDTMPRLVCVFSDRTRGSWDSGASVKRGAEKPVHLLYFDVGIDDSVDLAITHVELPRNYKGEMRQAFSEGEKIEVRAVVKATGQKVTSTLICKVGNNELRQTFNVEAGGQETVTLAIDSEKLSLKPGLHQAEIKLDTATDSLPFNDQRHVTFQIRDKPRVLVLADDLKRTEQLARALKALLYAVDHEIVTEKVAFNDYQSVFLAGVAAPDDKLWKELATHVEAGRGLCVIPSGHELQPKAYNNELAQKVLPARIGAKVVQEQGSKWDIDGNDLQHPFMRPFVGWLERGNVDFLTQPRRATAYWQVLPPEKDKHVRVIVHYDDDKSRPAVVERVATKAGKVLLLTTPMDARSPEWNNYGAKLTSFYLALTMLCAKHVGGDAENPNLNFHFGPEPPVVQKSLKDAFPKFLLSAGDSSEEVRFDEKDRWVGDRLSKAGNYTLFGSDPERARTEEIHRFSINVPGAESDLARIAKDDIEAVLGKNSLVPLDRRTSLLDSIGDNWSEPMDLFPWLMIAVLLFLAMENFIANKFYRQQTEAS
ncbi:MAG: VWA domain-containing protein [Gemmataceae bacterium]|nr:VWA domain-containing protein [Gemmataceae bacterium]